MSEEEWKRVSRPKIRCPSLAHYVLNSIGVVYKRPKPENLSSLPVQVKWPGFPEIQLFPVGEEKPVKQLHSYLPGRFLHLELGPQGGGFWEHSSISGEKESPSYTFSSNKAGIFQRLLKQCLLFHMPFIQCLFLGTSSIEQALYLLLFNLSISVTMQLVRMIICLVFLVNLGFHRLLYIYNEYLLIEVMSLQQNFVCLWGDEKKKKKKLKNILPWLFI